MTPKKPVLARRALLSGAAALPLVSIRTRPANAAEFSYKFANNAAATHPLVIRAQEAADRVLKATDGRVEIKVFPNSQLGSDTDTLGQLRSGAVEFFTLSGLILSTLVPVAAINGIGFAFRDYDQVWSAMDGKLGALVRAEITKRGLVAFDTMWDNGYRQMSSSSKAIRAPGDLDGFKMRVPPAPLWTGMFRAFGAAPTSINFNEVYSALQTHIVDGQENPLAIVDTAKLYEVQKYLSVTNHMWDGFWFLANTPRLRGAAARCARDRAEGVQWRSPDRAGGRGEAERDPAGLAAGPRTGVHPDRPERIPRRPAQGGFLQRMAGQVRRPGVVDPRRRGRVARLMRRAAIRAPVTATSSRPLAEVAPMPRVDAPARLIDNVEVLLRLAVEIPTALLVLVEICVLLAGVVSRFVFHNPFVWSDELASILFLWLAMFGAVVALQRGQHMRLTAIVGRLPGAWQQQRAEMLAVAVPALFLLLLLGPATEYAQDQWYIETPALEWSDMVRAGRDPGGLCDHARVLRVATAAHASRRFLDRPPLPSASWRRRSLSRHRG